MTQRGDIGSPVWVPSLRPLPTTTSFAWKGNWPGPPDGHSMMTTLNCAASTHRSSEGAKSHRTTCSASTPDVATNLPDLQRNFPDNRAVTLAYTAHELPLGGCTDQVEASFIDSGTTKNLNTGCASAIAPVPFKLPG
jgi:hypothetical protein